MVAVKNGIEMTNDKRHRDCGLPAIEEVDDMKEWYVNGKLHRDGGLPAVEHSDGSKEWWVNDIHIL